MNSSELLPEWRLPRYVLELRDEGNQCLVYDPIRRMWVLMLPEEEVRQHLIRWLIADRGISPLLISVEKEIRYRNMRRRFDLVIFDRNGHPWLLGECKAPTVPISQDTINQIARYNQVLGAPHLLVTNGRGLIIFSRNAQGAFEPNPAW